MGFTPIGELYVPTTQKGAPGGVATLENPSGKVPLGELPAGLPTLTEDFVDVRTRSPMVNVKHVDFGAVGDGIADDTLAIQAAHDALGIAGGTVLFPPGIYRVTAPITSTKQNVMWKGAGGPGFGTLGRGASVIHVDGAIYGIDIGTSSGSTAFTAPKFQDLHFRDATGAALGGLRVQRMDGLSVERCTFSDFAAGIGLDHRSGSVPYAMVYNCIFNDCLTAIYWNSNGGRILGCYINGKSTGPAGFVAGSTGIYVTGCDNVKVIATFIQMVETGVNLISNSGHELVACRFEIFDVGVRIGAGTYDAFLVGGTFVNTMLGTVGTGVIVEAGAQRARVKPGQLVSLATAINDAGTNTIREWMSGFAGVQAGELAIPPGLPLRGSFKVSALAASATIGNDFALLVDAAAAARTITLPDATTRKGQIYVIKKVDPSSNAVTIARTSAQTINGLAENYVLRGADEYVWVQSDGANWRTLADNKDQAIFLGGGGSLPALAYGTRLVDAAGAPATITLPDATLMRGKKFTIKKTDPTGNAVTVATVSAQTIDGAASYVLGAQHKYVTVQSSGSNWLVVANN